jgi:hypothetical protein
MESAVPKMSTRAKDHFLNAPENHADSVRCLVTILDSRAWLADLLTDIVAHCEIYGISACTPDWVAEQVAGPALFLNRSPRSTGGAPYIEGTGGPWPSGAKSEG